MATNMLLNMMMALPQKPFIPAGIYLPVIVKDGGKWWAGRADYQACMHFLEEAHRLLGISWWQMADLLQVRLSAIAFWRTGRCRIGSLCSQRLSVLKDLKYQGVPVALMSKIDWETGKIKWRRDAEGKYPLPGNGEGSQKKKGEKKTQTGAQHKH